MIVTKNLEIEKVHTGGITGITGITEGTGIETLNIITSMAMSTVRINPGEPKIRGRKEQHVLLEKKVMKSSNLKKSWKIKLMFKN